MHAIQLIFRKADEYERQKQYFVCSMPADNNEECGYLGSYSDMIGHFANHWGCHMFTCKGCERKIYEFNEIHSHQNPTTHQTCRTNPEDMTINTTNRYGFVDLWKARNIYINQISKADYIAKKEQAARRGKSGANRGRSTPGYDDVEPSQPMRGGAFSAPNYNFANNNNDVNKNPNPYAPRGRPYQPHATPSSSNQSYNNNYNNNNNPRGGQFQNNRNRSQSRGYANEYATPAKYQQNEQNYRNRSQSRGDRTPGYRSPPDNNYSNPNPRSNNNYSNPRSNTPGYGRTTPAPSSVVSRPGFRSPTEDSGPPPSYSNPGSSTPGFRSTTPAPSYSNTIITRPGFRSPTPDMETVNNYSNPDNSAVEYRTPTPQKAAPSYSNTGSAGYRTTQKPTYNTPTPQKPNPRAAFRTGTPFNGASNPAARPMCRSPTSPSPPAPAPAPTFQFSSPDRAVEPSYSNPREKTPPPQIGPLRNQMATPPVANRPRTRSQARAEVIVPTKRKNPFADDLEPGERPPSPEPDSPKIRVLIQRPQDVPRVRRSSVAYRSHSRGRSMSTGRDEEEMEQLAEIQRNREVYQVRGTSTVKVMQNTNRMSSLISNPAIPALPVTKNRLTSAPDASGVLAALKAKKEKLERLKEKLGKETSNEPAPAPLAPAPRTPSPMRLNVSFPVHPGPNYNLEDIPLPASSMGYGARSPQPVPPPSSVTTRARSIAKNDRYGARSPQPVPPPPSMATRARSNVKNDSLPPGVAKRPRREDDQDDM